MREPVIDHGGLRDVFEIVCKERDALRDALIKVLRYNHDSDKAERKNACRLVNIDPDTLEDIK